MRRKKALSGPGAFAECHLQRPGHGANAIRTPDLLCCPFACSVVSDREAHIVIGQEILQGQDLL